ncbi:MAG: hypothetical protein NWP87_01470, partial [Winogradskyella sp.]|nr:hypothetical protein [Winogradskyella sp.]
EDKLSEWYDLMLHYSRKKDTVKTIFYAENILKTVNTDKELFRFEANILSSTLKFYASFIQKKNPEEAIHFLDKAIGVQNTYEAIFFTKSFAFKLYKVKLLLEVGNYVEASLLLKELNTISENEEISNRFQLAVLNAKTAEMLHENEISKNYFDHAFTILNNSTATIESLKIDGLKPLIS